MGPPYAHEALFYGSDAELLDAVGPFLRDGAAAGETTMVVCGDRSAELLRDAVDGDPRVSIVPPGGALRRTPGALHEYRRLVERERASGGGRVRLVREVDVEADEGTAMSWTRYDAATNWALAACDLWSLCVYDRRRVSERSLRHGRLSHPRLVDAAGRSANPHYVQPGELLRRLESGPDPLQSSPPTWQASLGRLRTLRRDVRELLAAVRLPPQTLEELVLAIDEIASNAAMHGEPPVTVRVWLTPGRLLCTVHDRGDGFDDPFAGYLPAQRTDMAGGGRGLWLARQLCDDVSVSATEHGFTVRLDRSLPS
jgi:anti-sigma regulatory factor (Ser/Thr protein kinase)